MTAAPIYDIDQFVTDHHVEARQIVIDVPDDEVGRVTLHNVIPRLSATPGALRRPAPKLGEHTGEVLARLGIDADQLAVLRDEGIAASAGGSQGGGQGRLRCAGAHQPAVASGLSRRRGDGG